jgi:uncharacterized membrane protein
MRIENLFYKIGEMIESLFGSIRNIILPRPKETPPTFKFLRKIVRRKVTAHEMLILKIQLSFILYLIASLISTVLSRNPLYLVLLFILFFMYMRAILINYKEFFIEYKPYQVFFYLLAILSLGAFMGYSVLRRFNPTLQYLLVYSIVIFVAVLILAKWFKMKYGRDWTYAVVEEIRGEVVKISTHYDICANVKSGEYWIDAVPDLKVGSLVKVLVEERMFRGAIPRKIIEVYLDQPSSSNTSTEPKEENESSISL